MDFIFEAFSAWNSIGLFIMAFVFISIGGGVLAYELYWHVFGVRVKAHIKEVRVTSKVTPSQRSEQKSEQRTISKINDDKQSLSALTKDMKKTPFSSVIGLLFALLFLGLPLTFTGFGVHMGYKYYSLKSFGEYANARVIRNDSSYDSEGGTSYKAVLEFWDYKGQRREVKDSISYGNSPSYGTGTFLGVYYDADNPTRFVIDDYWHNMGIAIIFMCVFPIFFGFLMFVSYLQKRQNNMKSGSGRKAGAKYSGEIYYSVYEYQLPNGERHEHVSNMGSSLIGKNIPGRAVTVFVSARNAEKVKKPSYVLVVFGIIFLLPGLFVLHQAIETLEFNSMMFILPAAIIGYIAFKISKVISKIPRGVLREGFQDFRKNGVQVTSSSGKAENAVALTSSELRQRMRGLVKNYIIGGYLCLAIALGLAVGAYYLGENMAEKIAIGVSARGEVVGFESRYSSSSEGSGYTYYSVVEFIDKNGRMVKFEDRVGSSHRMHKRGDLVDILYDPENPIDAIIDRGIWNWGVSGGMAIAALLFMLLGLDNMRTARLYRGGRLNRV